MKSTRKKRGPRTLAAGRPSAEAGERVAVDGSALAAERARKGLSRRAFAELLSEPPNGVEVSGKTIAAWEQGLSRPLRECLAKMASVLGVPQNRIEAKDVA